MSTDNMAERGAPLVLAIDAGTSSVRALVYDATGRSIHASEVQLEYVLDTEASGAATYSAIALFDLTVDVLDALTSQVGVLAGNIVAVGVTSFWHSLLGLDRFGEPTTPIFYWADTRAAGEVRALRAQIDGTAVWQRTGCRLHSSYWPGKLRWLHANEPDTVRRTTRWVSFPEYALGRLCTAEAAAVTYCMASGTGLLDVHNLNWDEEMLAISGVSKDHLSPLVDLGPPGRLRPEFARRWPALESSQWYPALGDGACANVGSGAVGPQSMALTVGTSAAMRIILTRPPGTAWTVPPGLWAYRLDRSRAVLGGALSNGGNLLRWVLEIIGTERDGNEMDLAMALSPDSTGLTFLPFLAGERSPGWHDDATGVIAGLTLGTERTDLIRAALEAIPYRLAGVYEALAPLAETEHQILVSGGAILALPGWLQITADVLGRPLTALSPQDESTARGAALVAAVSAGLLADLESARDPTAGATVYLPNLANFDLYNAGRSRQLRLEEILANTGEFV